MRLTDEEVEVLCEAINYLLAREVPEFNVTNLIERAAILRTRAIAEDLYTRLRLDLAA